MSESEGGCGCREYDDEHPYDPDGLSIGGRIQDRACKYLELIFRPAGRNAYDCNIPAQCRWILEHDGCACCMYELGEREKQKIICPLNHSGRKILKKG